MRPYDVREVVARLFDGSEFDEYKDRVTNRFGVVFSYPVAVHFVY